MSSYVSVSEAAKIKDVTRQAIYLAIRLKRLRAYRIDDQWRIFRADLEAYDANRYSRLLHSDFKDGPIFDESKGIISVEKAAQMVNVPIQKIYYACRTGLLKATRKRSSWVINVEDLLRYEIDYLKKGIRKGA